MGVDSTGPAGRPGPASASRVEHGATFYEGPDDLARAVLPFVREGVSRGEPVLVAVLPDRITELRDELGRDASGVTFVDMAELGANPARIIPALQLFLHDHAGAGPVRGVGEPAWPGRRDVELVEAGLHEALMNLALIGAPPCRVLCPYDVTGLPEATIREARRTHPLVHGGVASRASSGLGYAGHDHARRSFAHGLPAAPRDATRIDFGAADLGVLRGIVRRAAEASRLATDRLEDLVLAAHETASNSILHAGGSGSLYTWQQSDALVVEIRDRGWIEDPLVGRRESGFLDEGGRGIWMANQLCDLVQVRSGAGGTQVRLHSWL